MMKRLLFALLGLLMLAGPARADEGMWLPSLIGSRIKDMQAKGFKLTAKDIYDINEASLKDGIVLFGRGCTGELVSNEGLLLTNHHCGYQQIQQHSTVEHDYLTNGFWAMNRAEELPNPGLTVTFLVRMEDVTDRINAGTDGLSEEELKVKRGQNAQKIMREAVAGTHYDATIEPFYYGNQFFLFVNEVFRDVRLVGAPPSSIGKFGGDTDNWMWPRHTGDFSIFRVYADKDNKPAEYSADNVPYTPKRFFHISTKGVSEGDFTMIYGFPGTTLQFIHSAMVDYIQNYSDPIKIHLRTIRLDEIKAASELDRATRIAYASKAANIANGWKKWQGEILGLERLGTVAKKREYEARYKAWAATRPEFSGVVDEMQKLYDELQPYAVARDYFNEAFGGIELMTAARSMIMGTRSGPSLYELTPLKAFYKDYVPEIDRRIAAQLLDEYIKGVPAEYVPAYLTKEIKARGSVAKYVDWLFDNSALADMQRLDAVLGDENRIKETAANDPAIVLFNAFQEMYRDRIAGKYTMLSNKVTALYTKYVKGGMEFEPQRDFFPDANLTLRVAYGKVEGYRPEDGVTHLPVSTVDGIIEKDNPEIYDYDIPQSLRDIYAAKDYGRWAANGTVPVCFLATNHTTGGNSGSPIINGNGELIGINFDRTWLSTMSDIEFDPAFCRNISVDIRYVLFVIDKIGGASYLFDEMVFDGRDRTGLPLWHPAGENVYVLAYPQWKGKTDLISFAEIAEDGTVELSYYYATSDKKHQFKKLVKKDPKLDVESFAIDERGNATLVYREAGKPKSPALKAIYYSAPELAKVLHTAANKGRSIINTEFLAQPNAAKKERLDGVIAAGLPQ